MSSTCTCTSAASVPRSTDEEGKRDGIKCTEAFVLGEGGVAGLERGKARAFATDRGRHYQAPRFTTSTVNSVTLQQENYKQLQQRHKRLLSI